MTPPIQDPSSARDQSGLGWATRQLARRPAPPASSGTVEWCRISTNNVSNVTVLSGTNKTISTFNQFETSTGGGSIFSTSSSSIEVFVDGLYLVKGQTEWDSYGTTIPTSIRETWIVITRSGNSFATATETEASPLNDFVMVNGWVFLLANDIASLVAHQDSGSSETILGLHDGGSTDPEQNGNWLQLAYMPMTVASL